MVDVFAQKFIVALAEVLLEFVVRQHDPLLIIQHDDTFGKGIKRCTHMHGNGFAWIQIIERT